MTDGNIKSKRIQDQAIYTKIYDLSIWLFPHIGKYPKSERATLGNRTKECLLEMLKQIVLAYNASRKLPYLREASAQLDLLRLPWFAYLRQADTYGLRTKIADWINEELNRC